MLLENKKKFATDLLNIEFDEVGNYLLPLPFEKVTVVSDLLRKNNISINSEKELLDLFAALDPKNLDVPESQKGPLFELINWIKKKSLEIYRSMKNEDSDLNVTSQNISSGENLSEVPVDVIAHLTKRNKTMIANNNWLNDTDLQALITRSGLKLREINGVKFIFVPELWREIASSTKAGTTYADMDSGTSRKKVRSIKNLKKSKKWRDFVDTIPWAEMMTNDEFFGLCNVITKRMGITQHFDKAYLDWVFSDHENSNNSNLPLTHEAGRVLRGLSVLLWDRYVHPLDVKWSVVRSAGCTHRFACLFNDEDDYYRIVSPPLKIRSS